MKVLVLGASGQTGIRVVHQLLYRNINTRILIREHTVLPDEIIKNPLLEIVVDSISEMNKKSIDDLIFGCDIVISCLGHSISFKGIFGKPRNLVYKAVKDICDGVKRSDTIQIKFILMSTTAFTNHMIREKNKIGEKIILSIFNFILPPHKDNMKAANYFVKHIGKEEQSIKWVLVRPDTLIELDKVTPYTLEYNIKRSPVFNAGKTSRVNVGNFMADLVTDENLWETWEFKTPVIYNQ